MSLHVFGLGLAHEGARRLNFPHAATASAMAIMKRYLYGSDDTGSGGDEAATTHPLLAAGACILLSAKAHDISPMPSVRSIVIVFYHIARARVSSEQLPRPMSLISSQHQVWCDGIRKTEMSVLKKIGFNIYSAMQDHAHSYLILILRTLDMSPTTEQNKPLIACAWTFLNDSWFVKKGGNISPRVVAAAALLSAAQTCDVSLPRGWSSGISGTDLDTVIRSVKSLRQSKTAMIPRWIPHNHDAALMLASGTSAVATAKFAEPAEKAEITSGASEPLLEAASLSSLVPRQLKKAAKRGNPPHPSRSKDASKDAGVGMNKGDESGNRPRGRRTDQGGNRSRSRSRSRDRHRRRSRSRSRDRPRIRNHGRNRGRELHRGGRRRDWDRPRGRDHHDSRNMDRENGRRR